MIPSVLSNQIRQAVEDFLHTRYPISTPRFAQTITDFIGRGEAFKGAYVSFQLPFKSGATGKDIFPELPLGFDAYLHQELAFERLSGPDPKPTIVATGTGSGKTEAFLYPILDYCRRHVGEPGIKAILIYPMNALATDQARRIASIIHENEHLKQRVTAGLYIGSRDRVSKKRMSADSVMTDRHAMRAQPPDILLTNYKMLDYLMVRPQDASIWKHNRPNSLRFIVVDELHTFDGAQGTDLACLLRRLQHRLKAPDLCPIGTSATLGPQDAVALRAYAQTIFGAEFTEDSIITEDRLSARDFLGDELINFFSYPSSPDALDALDPAQYDTLENYIAAQFEVWFGEAATAQKVQDPRWRCHLGQSLMQHAAFQNLVKIVETKTTPCSEVAHRLATPFTDLPPLSDSKEHVLESLLALVSHARHPQESWQPLLNMRIQFWIRELKRMVVSMDEESRLVWQDDLKDTSELGDSTPKHLPLAICRNCGAAGWAAYRRINDNQIQSIPRQIYKAFFSRAAEFCLLYPDTDTDAHSRIPCHQSKLCLQCLVVNLPDAKECLGCTRKETLLSVRTPDLVVQDSGQTRSRIVCMYCGALRSLGIAGAQAASLTSVAIGQLFGSRYNDDKKTITFSDSVQDASHRAGFFQARTFPFTVRTSLLQHIVKRGNSLALNDLAKSYVDAQRETYDTARFVGTYIAPNLCWRQEYEHLVKTTELPRQTDLVELVSKRLHWEVHRTFGLHARLGRSLENTRSATASASPEILDIAEERLLERLANEFGELRNMPARRLRQFLAGLIYRVRTSGGIVHPALDTYIRQMGKGYVMSERKIPYMPRMHRHSPRPAFITNGKNEAFLPLPRNQRRTWLTAWAAKSLFAVDELPVYLDQVYKHVLREVVGSGLMVCQDAGKHHVWGLRPDALQVTTDVHCWKCIRCRYQVSLPAHEVDVWTGMPCLRFTCRGTLVDIGAERSDYYRNRYLCTDVKRFVAEEHTGLLERAKREQVEHAFMRRNGYPWDPNIISCTPTLELGVDIGDLSSVILCSVPPTRANYVQRIGRAGRRDGNALALTVASGQPHDLYYFAAPEDMMAGHVDVPGTFLRAPAVLRRQLAAFSMDSWVASGINEKAVPHELRRMLGQLEQQDVNRFPYNWLAYVDNHASELCDQFIALFADSFDQESAGGLRNYVQSADNSEDSPLRYQVLQSIVQKRNEREMLRKRIDRLWKKIKNLKARPKDQNYEEESRKLHHMRRALAEIKNTIDQTPVFNFLCDEGILPNYAFPQSSVKLQSIILHDEGDRDKDMWTEEYVRSGMTAIREFAPGSKFYANGWRVKITQIEFGEAGVKQWRFCDNCAWCQMEAMVTEPQCPNCQSTNWNDIGRLFEMVRLSNVKSVSNDRTSRSHDEADEREQTYYRIATHVQFSREDVEIAHACNEVTVPFGFEGVRKAIFRIINFGVDDASRTPLIIAGQEQNGHGFSCCPSCGKVRLRGGDDNNYHDYGCANRGVEEDGVKRVFLYHEFESEAIRILLPIVAGQDQTRRIDSFCAALTMGLKEYFGGTVEHLQTTVQDEPIPGESEHKKFVFLYDVVPGGTGYLKDLLSKKENILEVLRHALAQLEACECALDESRDGCYRCLYAYRNNRVRDRISRQSAIDILTLILDHGGDLTRTRSLDDVDMNPLLESQCEVKLIEVLERRVRQKKDGVFRPVNRHGRQGYVLKLNGRTWNIECQVLLGLRDGVVIPSQPDFLFRPDSETDALPIAVFADGFKYHKAILADDTAKRMAILASGKYHVWSLSWGDLDGQATSAHYTDYISLNAVKRRNDRPFTVFMDALEQRIGSLSRMREQRSGDSLDLFMAFLEEPDRAKWTAFAYCHAIVNIGPQSTANWSDIAARVAPRWFAHQHVCEGPMVTGLRREEANSDHEATILVRSSTVGIQTQDAKTLQVILHLDDAGHMLDEYRPAWNGFLRVMNVFQFLPHSGFFCTTGLEQESYQALDGARRARAVAEFYAINLEWEVIQVECAKEVFADLLKELEALGAPAPVVGNDITDKQGRVMTSTAFSWPAYKVLVFYEHDSDARAVCESEGWTCFSVDEASAGEVLKHLE